MDDLCDGPRGRRVCLELAADADPELQALLFEASYEAAVDSGASIARLVFTWDGEDADAPAVPDAVEPLDPDERIARIAARIAALAAAPERLPTDAAALDAALHRSVDIAAYWQPPDGMDLVAAQPVVAAALAAIGHVVGAAPAAAWWTRERTTEQWSVEFDPDGDGAPFDAAAGAAARWAESTRAQEERARREWPQYPAERGVSSDWWSHPWGAPHTTGTMPSGVPAGIPLVEDGFGWLRAVAIPVRGAGRTLEIRSADDWAQLCARYPLEVTASHWYDWHQFTDHRGRWLLPDWERVATEWDAVHLTTHAYLTAATREIVVDAEYSSVIGGWGPDESYWLTGLVREWDDARQQWVCDRTAEGDTWRRA